MFNEERRLRGASQEDCTGYELQRAHSPYVEDEGGGTLLFSCPFWESGLPFVQLPNIRSPQRA